MLPSVDQPGCLHHGEAERLSLVAVTPTPSNSRNHSTSMKIQIHGGNKKWDKTNGRYGWFYDDCSISTCTIQPPRPVGMTTASIHVLLLFSSELPFPFKFLNLKLDIHSIYHIHTTVAHCYQPLLVLFKFIAIKVS